jgi:tetratricopeptide (TPR) repeat protein
MALEPGIDHGDNFDIVLGSRSPLPQHGIAHVEIEEPTSEQAVALLHKLATESGISRDSWAGLPRNPLILTLAALLRRQEITSRATLYREFLIDRMSRNPDTALLTSRAGLELLETCALFGTDLTGEVERLTAALLPTQLIGLARIRSAKRLLIATGAIREAGEQLIFLHESFRSFLKAEALARMHRPSPAPWDKVSPFREGWEVLGFMLEIWRRDGEEVTPALEGLLAFGEDGLRLAGHIASRDAGLPLRVIETIIAKWMHGDDENWSPGYLDGPVQQIGLFARHYECARVALRRIARDNWTYNEDAAYAARELARAGQKDEAQDLLIALARKDTLWGDRALAIDLLNEIGSPDEARTCALKLATEWPYNELDADIAGMHLASTLHKLGETRAATSMFKRIEAQIDDQLHFECLAGIYLEIGKPRKAKAAACRAFHTWEWSKRLRDGSSWGVVGLANLLDQVGATREAEAIRSDLDQVEHKPVDDLIAMARDCRQDGGKRLEASLELLKREPEAGIEALEALLNDSRVEGYRRFDEVSRLLDSLARQRTIEALKRIAADEPWHRNHCGSALVRAGEPEDGWALLTKVALEPGEELWDRIRAIEHLAQSGRVDLAMAGFRRLLHSGALAHDRLDRVEAALAYTAGWVEFLDACEYLLQADDPRLRIEALTILVRASRIQRGAKRAINLLEHLVRDRDIDPEVRRRALIELEDMDGDALDVASDIADDPEESLEAGLTVVEFLARRDSFEAVDCGHAVVWDKKLSPDQFIKAAHRFLSMTPHFNEDGLKDWGSGIRTAIEKKVLQIATDRNQPVERRLAAAGVTGDEKNWREKGLSSALDAICNDSTLSLRERLPALHDILVQDPSQYGRWKDLFWGEEISRIEAAHTCLTSEINMRDVAAEFFHAALEQEDDLHIHAQIWQELVKLAEGHFAGAEAAKALREVVRANEMRLDADLATSLLSMSEIALNGEDFKMLVAEVAAYEKLEPYAFSVAARALTDIGLHGLALDLLSRRKLASMPNSNNGRPYDHLLMLRVEASLGRADEAIESMKSLCSNPKGKIPDRALACQILSQFGRTREADHYLEKLASRAESLDDRLTIARSASALHNWGLARRILLASKALPQTPSELCQFAFALVAAGLKSQATEIAKALDTQAPTFRWDGGFDLLLECGQHRSAEAICRRYLGNSELNAEDGMEALGKLGDAGAQPLARRLLVTLIAQCGEALDQTTGATTLHRLGFEAEARTIFFGLADQNGLSANSILWVCDAMLDCGLPSTAFSMLAQIDEKALDGDERAWLTRMNETIRLIPFERSDRVH